MLSRPDPARTSSRRPGAAAITSAESSTPLRSDDGVAVGDRVHQRHRASALSACARRTTRLEDRRRCRGRSGSPAGSSRALRLPVSSMAATTSATTASSGRSTSTTTNSGTSGGQLEVLLPTLLEPRRRWPRACGRAAPRRRVEHDHQIGLGVERARASSRGAAAAAARDGVRPRRRRGSSRAKKCRSKTTIRPRSAVGRGRRAAEATPRASRQPCRARALERRRRDQLAPGRLVGRRHAGCWPPGPGARRGRASPPAAAGWSGASASSPRG